MAIKYNQKEIEAMDAKLNNPSATVVCPRCGKELLFNDYSSFCEVKCSSSDCLHGVVRGI